MSEFKDCPHCRGTGQPNGIKGGRELGDCAYCDGTGFDRSAMPTPASIWSSMAGFTGLTRPIIGIENRTPQEVYQIMCDRINVPASTRPAPSRNEVLEEAAKVADRLENEWVTQWRSDHKTNAELEGMATGASIIATELRTLKTTGEAK